MKAELVLLFAGVVPGLPCPSARAKEPEPVTFGSAFEVPDNRGDTWVGAWAADGMVYSPSDDCQGFDGGTVFANIAFNRISGDEVRHLRGVTVNGMAGYGKAGLDNVGDGRTWKSSGAYAVDGVLYWVIARHRYGRSSGDPYFRQTVRDASIIKSTDGGRTWTRSAEENRLHPMFPGNVFATPYFIQYGRDGRAGVDDADRYVYAISNNGFFDNGDRMILGRVRRDRLARLDRADWRFYIGGDGGNEAAWGSDPSRAAWLLHRPGRLGATGAIYLPKQRRYLMIGWNWPQRPLGSEYITGWSNTSVWDFYEAPKPWGPWTRFDSRIVTPAAYYAPEICQKFIDRDGWLYAFTAGDFQTQSFYHLTVVPLKIDWEAADRVMAEARSDQAAGPPRFGQPCLVNEGAIRLQWIPAGTFQMGSAAGGRDDERPVTTVHITRGFWLGRYDVTQVQWERIMGAAAALQNPESGARQDPVGPASRSRGPYPAGRPRFQGSGDSAPMDSISWNSAETFCARLNRLERAAGRLPPGYEYRLPTEAEWEYACRAGTADGDDGDLDGAAWYLANADGRVHPSGQKRPNAWGLYDMHGNIRQWCYDWYAPYTGGEVFDPAHRGAGIVVRSRDDLVPDAYGAIAPISHVNRGGSWGSRASDCRSASRAWSDPFKGYYDQGMRLALAPVLR